MRYILLIFLAFAGVSLGQDTELANYRSAIKLAFGVGDGSDRGTAYAEEYFYHDKLVWDQKTVYIRDDTPISMSFVASEISIINSGDGTGKEDGDIKYRFDRDWTVGDWLVGNGTHKWYTAPITFAGSTDTATGLPIVGTTGPRPGYAHTHANKNLYFWRGSLDSVGDEYHTINAGLWLPLTAVKGDNDFAATDGKYWVFCVNPKTPCLIVRATGDGQFYTTPIKNYYIPKIFDQTTYFNAGTGTVTFELRNLYASDVRYRINGGSWVDAGANNVTLDQDDFSSGSNTLEYYYEGNEAYVKTRTVVKNPTHPSLAESHGDLLWGTSDLLTRFRARRTSEPTTVAYWNRHKAANTEYQATADRVITGRRHRPSGVLPCAFNAHELGLAAVPYTGSPKRWAEFAKEKLLMNMCRIDPVGLEVFPVGVPVPSREIHDRGYYTVGTRGWLMENVFAYDLLVDFFRSDQDPEGITAIEDLYIRDLFARWVVFTNCHLGYYYNGSISSTNMWERANYMASYLITLAMPSYSTPHGGTSGWDGNTTVYEDVPFPDVGHTWKTLYIDESNDVPGYPNPHQRPRYDNLFTPVGTYTNTGGILIDQAWGPRFFYCGHQHMGYPLGVLGMMAKLHTGKDYPNFFACVPKGKLRTMYAREKLTQEPNSAYGPHMWVQIMMNNSLFPEHTAYFMPSITQNAGYKDEAILYNRTLALLYFDTAFGEDTEPEADVTPPTLTSATVNAQGNRLTLVYSEDVEDVDPAHYSLSTGNTLSALGGVGNTWQFTIASPIITDTDVPTLSYTSGAGRTADVAGNLLATIAARAVVNNSLETTPVPPRAGRRGRGANVVPAGR